MTSHSNSSNITENLSAIASHPNSIFSSRSGERIWVDLIHRSLNQDLKIKIDITPSIFLVPTTITAEKPEAYTPQQIGLGPYHHLNPELYQMQGKKLAAVRGFLGPDQVIKFQELALPRLKDIEPTVRGHYNRYLDLDADTLVWILGIDALFLLQHLVSYSKEHKEADEAARKSAQDIFMLESQIPSVVLETIRAALQLLDPDDGGFSQDNIASPSTIYSELYRAYDAFCREFSPLKLTDFEVLCILQKQEIHHLLDFMYRSIVKNRRIYKRVTVEGSSLIQNNESIMETIAAEGNSEEQGLQKQIESFRLFWEKAVTAIRSEESESDTNTAPAKQNNLPPVLPGPQTSPLQALLNIFNFTNILGDNILSAIRFSSPDTEKLTKEINIPSVSELSTAAKVKFKVIEGGIRDVNFDEKELTFYLPTITLNVDSEVVLRNLLAYEALVQAGSTLELAEYIDLMCGIIDTADDVKLLKDEKIIEGNLTDEQIADLFNRIEKSTAKDNNSKSKIEEAIGDLTERYESRPSVRFWNFMKNVANGLWESLKVIWKILAWIATVFVVLLLIYQSFCQVFGCPGRLFNVSGAYNLGIAYGSSSDM